jgi:hypothetical protein
MSASDNTATFRDFIIPRNTTEPQLTFERFEEYVKLMKRRGWFNFEEVDGILKCIFSLHPNHFMGSFMNDTNNDEKMIAILQDFKTIEGIDVKPLLRLIMIIRMKVTIPVMINLTRGGGNGAASNEFLKKLIYFKNHGEFWIASLMEVELLKIHQPTFQQCFDRTNMGSFCFGDNDNSILDEIEKYYMSSQEQPVVTVAHAVKSSGLS